MHHGFGWEGMVKVADSTDCTFGCEKTMVSFWTDANDLFCFVFFVGCLIHLCSTICDFCCLIYSNLEEHSIIVTWKNIHVCFRHFEFVGRFVPVFFINRQMNIK